MQIFWYFDTLQMNFIYSDTGISQQYQVNHLLMVASKIVQKLQPNLVFRQPGFSDDRALHGNSLRLSQICVHRGWTGTKRADWQWRLQRTRPGYSGHVSQCGKPRGQALWRFHVRSGCNGLTKRTRGTPRVCCDAPAPVIRIRYIAVKADFDWHVNYGFRCLPDYWLERSFISPSSIIYSGLC